MAAIDASDTAIGYFLKNHTVVTTGLTRKNLPGSILLLNRSGKYEESASIILRLLISWGRISTLNSILEGYPSIWTSANLLTALKVMLAR